MGLYPEVRGVRFGLSDRDSKALPVNEETGEIGAELATSLGLLQLSILTESTQILPVTIQEYGRMAPLHNWGTYDAKLHLFQSHIVRFPAGALLIKPILGRLQLIDIREDSGLAKMHDCAYGIHGGLLYLLGQHVESVPVHWKVNRPHVEVRDFDWKYGLRSALGAAAQERGLLKRCIWPAYPGKVIPDPMSERIPKENQTVVRKYNYCLGYGVAELVDGSVKIIRKVSLPQE